MGSWQEGFHFWEMLADSAMALWRRGDLGRAHRHDRLRDEDLELWPALHLIQWPAFDSTT